MKWHCSPSKLELTTVQELSILALSIYYRKFVKKIICMKLRRLDVSFNPKKKRPMYIYFSTHYIIYPRGQKSTFKPLLTYPVFKDSDYSSGIFKNSPTLDWGHFSTHQSIVYFVYTYRTNSLLKPGNTKIRYIFLNLNTKTKNKYSTAQ